MEGSVDEKLQTCDFKRKQYMKLVSGLGLTVKYVYVLNEWFSKKHYKDVLRYITSMGCHYKFDEIPVEWLGLPTRTNQVPRGNFFLQKDSWIRQPGKSLKLRMPLHSCLAGKHKKRETGCNHSRLRCTDGKNA